MVLSSRKIAENCLRYCISCIGLSEEHIVIDGPYDLIIDKIVRVIAKLSGALVTAHW